MKNKLLAVIGLLMLTLWISGCNMNDQNPPPENNTPGVVDDDVGTPNDGTGTNGTGTNNDVNTDTDKDMMRDNNDPNEEIIEDDLDRNDPDNVDR